MYVSKAAKEMDTGHLLEKAATNIHPNRPAVP